MIIRILSYTARGQETARRAADALKRAGHSVETYALPKFAKDGDEPLSVSAAEWAKDGFQTSDALLFVCAAGIAVRAIAPWVKDKTTDPAVLVIDEAARFAIPLLSGHIGGANALARVLSEALGLTPVITTATDINDLFAVDVFASENHLRITDMGTAKAVSAALLSGTPVGFYSDLPVRGTLPRGLTAGEADIGVCVSETRKTPFERTLLLIPQRYALGVGCRKDRDAEALDAFITKNLAACGVLPEALRCMASIDIKRDEPGLIAFAKRHGLPFYTYSADELNAAPGVFHGSEFVKRTTGTDSVSERAAVRASNGTLTVSKIAEDGMTFALARFEEEISF